MTRIPSLGRSLRVAGDIRAYRALRDEIQRFRPHIVHTHTAKAGVLGRAAAFRTVRCATLHTFHGHLLRGYFSPTMTRVVVDLERRLARPPRASSQWEPG